MKKLICLLLLVSPVCFAAASVAGVQKFMTDKSGLNWYETGAEQVVNDWDDADDDCKSLGLAAPSRDQAETASADLKQAFLAGKILNQCYWTRSHTALDIGWVGFFFIFDASGDVSVTSMWDSNAGTNGCAVRCVDNSDN